MDDPDFIAKSAKFRSPFIDDQGKVINCQPGDKLFIQTKLSLASHPSSTNFPVFVKSLIKTISGDTVTISEVSIIGDFRDPFKQSVIKSLDLSKFSSQFRNKQFTLSKDGRWGIVNAGTSSGLSQVSFQEDLPKMLGLQEDLPSEHDTPAHQLLAKMELLADALSPFNLSKQEIEIIYEVIHVEPTEYQHVTPISQVIKAYNQDFILSDEDSPYYIQIVQAVAEAFGSSLIPGATDTGLTEVANNLSSSKTDSLTNAVNKIVQKITMDNSLKLNSIITDPPQYEKFLTAAKLIPIVIGKARDVKKSKENDSHNLQIVAEISAPTAPFQPQPQKSSQDLNTDRILEMMAKYSERTDDVRDGINQLTRSIIPSIQATIQLNKSDTESRLNDMEKLMEHSDAKIKNIERLVHGISSRFDNLGHLPPVTTNVPPVVPALPPLSLLSEPRQSDLPKKLQEYLKHTNEDLSSIKKAQWLIELAIDNKIDLSKDNKLHIINNIIHHRDVLLTSIAAFSKHVETVEARRHWDLELSKTSKTVSRSAEKFHEFRSDLSTIIANNNVEPDIKQAISSLLTHLHNVYLTLDNLTTTNHDFILEKTGGTFSVQKRELKVMIESIPIFSGEDSDDSVPWYEVEAALDNIPQITSFNQSDAISKFMSRLQGQAREAIGELDIGVDSTLKSVTNKLKLIYGHPIKVLRQIRRKHFSIGDLNHCSANQRFQQVMRHKFLIQRTHACISKAENKEEAESVLYIRDEVFSLINLLPKDKLNMARAMHMSGSPLGFHLTHHTTARQMYSFFSRAITEIYTDLEAEISITSTQNLHPDLLTHKGLLVLQHDTSRPPPPMSHQAQRNTYQQQQQPPMIPPQSTVPPYQPQFPPNDNDDCSHCTAINHLRIKTTVGPPFISDNKHKRSPGQTRYCHPENCRRFMSLNHNDKERVLDQQKFCKHCAGKHNTYTQCSTHWSDKRRPPVIRCKFIDPSSNTQCHKHFIMCQHHTNINSKRINQSLSALELPHPSHPQTVPSNLAHIIQTTEELDIDPGVTIDPPKTTNITAYDTCFNSTHTDDSKDKSTHPASKRFLSVFKTKTNSGETILTLADPGATLSIINSRALPRVTPYTDNGVTKLSGLANNVVGVHPIKKFYMATSFGSKWTEKDIDAAVLDQISMLQPEDLTKSIKIVLQCIQDNRPDLMITHKDLLKLEHFQTSIPSGDIDLLLGIDRQSMHPRPLILFNQDIAICYIRQPVEDEKYLILTGSTKNISTLDGNIESYIDPQTILTLQNSTYFSIQEKFIHSTHCDDNQHHLSPPLSLDEGNNLTERDVSESEEITDSEEEPEQYQNHSPKVIKSRETHNTQQVHTNDSSEDSEAEEMPQEDNLDCLDEDSGTRQEILQLIDTLKPASDPIEAPEIVKATETTNDETEPVTEKPEIEKANETTNDVEAEPVTSITNAKVPKKYSFPLPKKIRKGVDRIRVKLGKEKGKTNKQSNSTETTATSTDYKVISDHSPQSFLSINPPPIFTT